MRWGRMLRLRWRALTRKNHLERELSDEIRFHLEMEIERFVGQGAAPEEARRLAYRSFGGVERHKERVREARGVHGLETLTRDVRYGLRRLRRQPGFTLVSALTLAIGIGATTAIFSVLKGVLLAPLPYADPDRLVSLWHETPGSDGTSRNGLTTGSYFVYSEGSSSLGSVAAYVGSSLTMPTDDGAARVRAAFVTHTFFPTLRVAPALGRAFTEADDAPPGSNVVMLGHEFWKTRLGANADAIGRTLTLNEQEFEIVGVLPEGFHFPNEETELWIPLGLDPATARAVNHYLRGIGRLADGATVEQATAELQLLYPRVFERYTGEATYEEFRSRGTDPVAHRLKDTVVGEIGEVLWVLMAAVGLILLIACANVANLFLVQAEGRDREVAVRIAMGASRRRVARHFLVEAATLGLLGGVAGVGLAWWGLRSLLAIVPEGLPRQGEVGLDATVLGFAVAVSLLSGLFFGTIPVLRLRKRQPLSALKEGGRGGGEGRERHRARNALVASQLALALVLLTGSGLMLRTFWSLRSVDPGFRTANLLTFGLSLPSTRYPGEDERVAFAQQVLDDLEALPGVVSATAGPSAFGLPFQSPRYPNPIWVEDFPPPAGEWPDSRSIGIVMPSYFRTLEIPILEGRSIERRDIQERTGAIVVSQAFAREYWGDESAIGKRVKVNDDWPWQTIVGVVGDTKASSLRAEPTPTIFWGAKGLRGFVYTGVASLRYAVRTTGDPAAVLPAVRETIRRLDPSLPLASVLTMDETLTLSRAGTSFVMLLLAIAASMALMLGAVGTYGVLAYAAARRTREIGIRKALGAKTGEIVRMVLRQGSAVIGIGVGLGLGGAVVLTRFLESLLFGVAAVDAVTYAGVSILLAAVGLLASYVPARRAAAVEPMEALRYE